MTSLSLGGLDVARMEANNRRHMRISYRTCGKSSDPCVLVPPGGGATKENSLFWAKELAAIGRFYVVMYDLRGTGASEKQDWKELFAEHGTTAEDEALRVMSERGEPEALNAELMEELWDYDAHVHDAIAVLDELHIEKAHVMGLSQGGFLAQMIAMEFPERVLTCVSAGTVFDGSGVELAMLSPGAEEFYDQVKRAGLRDKKGKTPWTCDTVTLKEYVAWKVACLEIIIPGFAEDVYTEIAEKEFEAGIVTPEEGAVCALSWKVWERMGKLKRHHERLRSNKVPMMYVHGRKDPIIHFGEVERLFRITKTCVVEAHEFGHNFGPPAFQKKILGRIATFMKKNAKGLRGKAAVANHLGGGTFAEDVSVDLDALASGASVVDLYDTFCSVQTAAETHAVFNLLVEKLGLNHLRDCGLKLFVELKAALDTVKLSFKQGKLLRDVYATLLKAQNVVSQVKWGGKQSGAQALEESMALFDEKGRFNEVLVCGAGPIGLRTACELLLLGFRVTVVEKRLNFSRANILTFWDETTGLVRNHTFQTCNLPELASTWEPVKFRFVCSRRSSC